MVTALHVLKVCVFLSGLICLSRITSTSASVSNSTSDLQSTDFGIDVTKGHDVGNDDGVDIIKSTFESNKKKSFMVKLQRAIVDPFRHQKNRKINVKSLVSPQFTLDKVFVFIETSNNLLNGNTNFTRLDKFMRQYDRLYTSDGMSAVNNFLNMCVSFWTVVDAVANIFRAYETRYLNAKDENKPPEPNPLEDLQASLDDANNNIAIVSDLFQTVGRMGELDDISAESDRDDDPTQILKRRTLSRAALLQGKPQEEDEDDDESEINRDDNDVGENNEDEDTIDSINSEQQQNYQSELPVETSRRLSYPAHFVGSNSANNPQTLYYLPTDRNDHSNPVSDSQQIRRFSIKSDSDSSLISRQSVTKTTIVQPSNNLQLQKAITDRVVRTLIRNKRSNLGQYDFGIDRFVYVMTKMNNALNSNTNNRQLNRFTRAFNDLFASDGLSAFNTFYTLLASFWTIVDAVANVFRFNEARIRDQIQQNQAENQPDPLADLQTELDDTNANLEEVAELVTTLDAAAGARRVENVADNEFRRSGVKNKKKKKKTAGSRRKKPSLPTTPQPTRHFYNPVTRGSYHHIQPASSNAWQPMDKNWFPINPRSSVETNRHFYYPVVYGDDNLNNRQKNPLIPSSTTHNNFSPIGHKINSVGHQTNNPALSSIPAVRYAMNYDSSPVVSRWSNLHPSSEINRYIYPAARNDDYHKYNSRMGLRPSAVSGQRYRKSSAIVQPKRK